MIQAVNSHNFSALVAQDSLESIKSTLDTIEVMLKSNLKMLLAESELTRNQLDILSNDFNEAKQKYYFCSKLNHESINKFKLDDLKHRIADLERQFQILTHITILKKLERKPEN